ncbi:MAG: hypothetical protein WA323_15140 [Candidatus Nitrosopolaris sp.]
MNNTNWSLRDKLDRLILRIRLKIFLTPLTLTGLRIYLAIHFPYIYPQYLSWRIKIIKNARKNKIVA